MPRTYVSLDLETTGLNPERDAIIEVGAVKFRDGEPVEEFGTLVNPGRSIPYEIQQLTGIRDEDVAGKPRFRDIAGQLMRFVGALPVVGHNVGFDLSFCRVQGLLRENIGLDTWELAGILLPSQASYSLGALAEQFGLQLENAHRAQHDALATGRLYNLLTERAAALPRAVLAEIGRLTQHSAWPAARIFEELLPAAGLAKRSVEPVSLEEIAPDCPLWQPLRSCEPLTPREDPEPIDVTVLEQMLAADGAFSQAFPGYEYRAPQVAMLDAVAGAFNQQHHLMAEAGTGTGKSLAYLLPAIAYSVQNHCRVVVSTNTINLQDQLFKKDLPDLQQILGAAWDKAEPFRAALLKGRGNYLCLRRFNALRLRPSLSPEELRGIVRILAWLPTTRTGDMSELSLPLPADRFVWSQVAADDEGCSLDRCQREQGGRCFFFRARRQADAAHVVVVNHSLLMADAATANRVLPEYHHLVIDEAHHLEGAVTDQLSFKADSVLLKQELAGIHVPGSKAAGLLGDIATGLGRRLPEELAAQPRAAIRRVQSSVEELHRWLDNFWDVLADLLRTVQAPSDNGDYDLRIRITETVRSQPIWSDVETSWANVAGAWHDLIRAVQTLTETLDNLRQSGLGPAALGDQVEALHAVEQRLTETCFQLEAWCARPEANSIYWIESSAQSGRVTVCSAPLHVGPLVRQHILFHSDTVVMTSATLRTGGSFDYVRDRLDAHEADLVAVGSPFDYESSTLLYLPGDLPEPTAPGYQSAVERTLIELARALGGRTLALFTSYAQLKRTAQAIAPVLAGSHIRVLTQGGGTSRHQLLEQFKSGTGMILLGTRSFWEGVDVIGPALSALVMVRLPFAVPTDPVVAARSETFDDPFYNYSVPDAILRFRQGFGRLIRSKSDRGVVVVLDKRIQSKSYGQLFLESLPECTVHRGPLMNLPATARDWVAAVAAPPSASR